VVLSEKSMALKPEDTKQIIRPDVFHYCGNYKDQTLLATKNIVFLDVTSFVLVEIYICFRLSTLKVMVAYSFVM
jgi:hypothetical protein